LLQWLTKVVLQDGCESVQRSSQAREAVVSIGPHLGVAQGNQRSPHRAVELPREDEDRRNFSCGRMIMRADRHR